MATLQASLLSKPPLSVPFSLPFLSPNHSLHPFSFNPTRLRPRVPSTLLHCTFRPDNTASSLSEPNPNPSQPGSEEPVPNSVEGAATISTEDGVVSVSDSNESRFEAESSENVARGGVDSISEGEKKEGADLVVGGDSRLPIVVFLVGLWVRAREGLERAFSEFSAWWPFWRQEKRLARLIADADANPQDAAKQSALFVELNKHRSVYHNLRGIELEF